MRNRVVIIGGGASGVLLSVHLLRQDPETTVTLVEKRQDLGAGAAYATNHPDHLLNVRASNMSAFPDDPGHFARWLRQDPASAHPGYADDSCFAPRHLYRNYLAGLLAPCLENGRLSIRHGEACRIVERQDDVWVEIGAGGGLSAEAGVLATGNEGPSLPAEPWRFDGWSTIMPGDISPDAPVLVVGTGLTMVDRVMALLHLGHRGPITAVSRHGLQPQSHCLDAESIDLHDVPIGATLRRLTRWLRIRAGAERIHGKDWRGTIDGLRPHTQAIWRHLSLEDRRQFLRHLRTFWDVHRHRIAPSAAQALSRAQARGQLSILAGRVTGFRQQQGGVDVDIVLRGSGRRDVVRAVAVFECRGRSGDVTATENPVLQAMMADGIARPDELKLGLDVTERFAVIRQDGTASHRLFALGPVTAGVLWETVAVPDIRLQAEQLAATLTSLELAGRQRPPPARIRADEVSSPACA